MPESYRCLQRLPVMRAVTLVLTIILPLLPSCNQLQLPNKIPPALSPSPSELNSSTKIVTPEIIDSAPTPAIELPAPVPNSTATPTASSPSSQPKPQYFTPTSTPTAAGAITYFISPSGSDENSGASPSSPWKTFRFAILKLEPGDTLILLDDTYTLQDSGMIEIICNQNGGPQNGLPGAPITIQAQNERRALLKSDGSIPPVYIEDCSNWVIAGLSATSADNPTAERNHIFSIRDSTNITFYRLLGAYANRYFNSHPFAVNASSYILILESEAYYFHRHGFDAFQSHHVTFQRCYANSRNFPDLPDGFISDRPGGDETFVLYHTSDSIIENSIAEFETRGFEIHGGLTYDGLPGGHNNQILGSIHMNGHYGAEVDTRLVDGVIQTSANNLYKDFLVINANDSGFLLNSSVGTRLENVTIFNGNNAGVRADEKDIANPFCPQILGGCSFTITNSLIFNNQTYGLRIANNTKFNWLVEYSNITGNGNNNFPGKENIDDDLGNVRSSLSVPAFGLSMQGNQTLIYIPDSSNMKGAGKDGADIGANILYRYENGVLTTAPLWETETGAFPCGAQVAGINDMPGFSCFDVHHRLNVSPDTLPVDYLTRFK